MATEPQQMLGHYRLDERIGEGGMGVVYRALNTNLQRVVAVKLLRPDLLTEPAARHRFRKEALAISRVDHPNIAGVYDFDTHDGRDFLVMEYVPGCTLQEKHQGAWTERELLQVAVQLADALHAAHMKGVIHCDVKPSNLRITAEGCLKVLDFGLANFRQAATASTSTSDNSQPAGGTPPYMAPEQFETEHVDARTDVYGIGAVLYEMATGRRPFEEKSPMRLLHAILQERPTTPRALNGRISVALEGIILKCLDKDPKFRYQAAHELHSDLERLLHPSPLPVRPRRVTWWRRPTAILGGAAAAVILAIVAYFRIHTPIEPPPVQMMPLVTWPGAEWGGSISPDGKWVAFGASHDHQQGLWLVPASGGEPRLVVAKPDWMESYVWSPAGDEIAYLTRDHEETSLHFVAAFAGTQRKSMRLEHSFPRAELIRWTGSSLYLDALRDGFWRLDLATEDLQLVMPAVTSSGVRRHFDVCGTQVTYTVTAEKMVVCATDLSQQKTVELTPRESAAFWARWVGPDCRQLVYSSTRGGQTDLWRISVDSHQTSQITSSAAAEQIEDASADGTRILFLQSEDRGDLWRMRPGEAAQQLRADRLQVSWPSAAFAGHRLAFQRESPLQEDAPDPLAAQILLANLSPGKLSEADVIIPNGGLPRLSPDGHWLAYVRPSATTRYELWMMDCDTRRTWCVSPHFRVSNFHWMPRDWWQTTLAWDAAGRLLFVARTDSGAAEIRTMEMTQGSGSQSNVVVAAEGTAGYGDLYMSPDGRWLAYSRSERHERESWEVHVRDLGTGEDRILVTRSGIPGWSMLHVRGWLTGDAAVVVLNTELGTGSSSRADVVAVDLDGRARSLGVFEQAFAGSARFDPRTATLYVTCEDEPDGPHNLYALSVHDGTRRRLTQNAVPGISFAGIEVLDDGALVYVQQQQNEDLWLIRSGP